MSKQAKPPPNPDLSGLIAAQQASAELSAKNSADQLAWSREQYANDRTISNEVIHDSMRRQDMLDTQANKDRARWETTFRPQEDALLKDAAGFTTERNMARGDAAGARAAADVSAQSVLARAKAQDALEKFGIDPSQTRSAALDLTANISEAASRAAAANTTREGVTRAEENTGRQLRSDAINLGDRTLGRASANSEAASRSGALAANTGLATTASGASTIGTGAQWAGLSDAAHRGQADTVNSSYKNAVDLYKAKSSQSSGWGAALGTLGGIAGKVALGTATGGLGFFPNPKETFGYAHGGVVEGVPTGPPVSPHPMPGMGIPIGPELSPSGGKAVDDVAAYVNEGEFIIPAPAARWYGEEKLQKMIAKAAQDKAKATAKPTMMAGAMGRPALDTDNAQRA